MHRIYSRFDPLCEQFKAIKLFDPIHTAILVIVTDDKPQNSLVELQEAGEFFQVIAGCSPQPTDEALAREVLEILHQVVQRCPFSTPDRNQIELLFSQARID